MKVVDVFIVVSTLLILSGIWQFIWISITQRGYLRFKDGDETFYDFCCRYYSDELVWKLRKKLNLRWFYNSKLFLLLLRVKGFLHIVLGICVIVFIYVGRHTDYSAFFDVKL